MYFRPTVVALALGVWCAPSGAQTAPPSPATPEVSSSDAPVIFSSRVNLVSVPVVLRDRDGHAVGNLRQEDFQLFDKGKPQVITKFSIEKSGGAAPTEAAPGAAPNAVPSTTPQDQTQAAPVARPPVLPERYVAYLVDDVHLKAGDLLQMRQAMHRHLDEALDPASRAAIFTTGGTAQTDFTDDRAKLHATVNRVQPYTSGPDPQQDCPSINYYAADLLVNKMLYLDGHLFSDTQLVQMVANGTADTALTTFYFEALNCMGPCAGDICSVMAMNKVREAARLALTYGDRETLSALRALREVTRRLSAMPGNKNLVLVSPGFLLTRDHQSEEYDVIDRAIRANVVVNTIDMRGLYTIIPGGDASTRNTSTTAQGTIANTNYEREAATQAADVMAEIANGTGGTFFHNDNELKLGLNLLAARPEYVYVLGFSPDNLKYDGSYHNLKVTVRNASNLTLQVRRGYWAPKHESNPAEQAQEEIREAVFSREEVQDIPMDVQTEFFKSTDSAAELTVVTHLDLKGLQFRKTGDRNNDTLTVVSGLFDANGNFINGIQKVIELHLRDQTLAAMQNNRVTLNQNFHVPPGRYVVRVVVRDAEGMTMSARNGGVEIP